MTGSSQKSKWIWACKMSPLFDFRPTMGYINFCPGNLALDFPRNRMIRYSAMHEMAHAFVSPPIFWSEIRRKIIEKMLIKNSRGFPKSYPSFIKCFRANRYKLCYDNQLIRWWLISFAATVIVTRSHEFLRSYVCSNLRFLPLTASLHLLHFSAFNGASRTTWRNLTTIVV